MHCQSLGCEAHAPFATAHSVNYFVAGGNERRAWVEYVVKFGLDALPTRTIGGNINIGVEDGNLRGP